MINSSASGSDATTYVDARLLLPEGIEDGWLRVVGERIVAIGRGAADRAAGRVESVAGAYLAPGLVDIHCHGAEGAVVYTGEDDLRRVAAAHLARGTTSMIASVPTVEADTMISATRTIERMVSDADPANLAGLHLEGPFLAEQRSGAQTRSAIRRPDQDLLDRLLDAAGSTPVMITIAPELEGALKMITGSAERCRFAIGHTDADYRLTLQAVDAGARHVTHLFNAMPPLGHRSPGPVAAALTDGRISYELIADGHHVDAPVLALAAGVDDGRRAVLVTDASAAAGLPDGRHRIADRELEVTGGVVRRIGTGRLAGSSAFLIDCVRHLVHTVGVPLNRAVAMASQNPAAAAGLKDRGRLRVGHRADLLVLTDELQIVSVVCAGAPQTTG